MPDWLTYRLSDFLLFSPRTYYRMFELYHTQVWPIHLVVLGSVVGIVVLLRREEEWRDRAIAGVLAVWWLWVAIAFHLQRYATINWAARYFAALFVIQALLLLWFGVVRGSLRFRLSREPAVIHGGWVCSSSRWCSSQSPGGSRAEAGARWKCSGSLRIRPRSQRSPFWRYRLRGLTEDWS